MCRKTVLFWLLELLSIVIGRLSFFLFIGLGFKIWLFLGNPSKLKWKNLSMRVSKPKNRCTIFMKFAKRLCQPSVGGVLNILFSVLGKIEEITNSFGQVSFENLFSIRRDHRWNNRLSVKSVNLRRMLSSRVCSCRWSCCAWYNCSWDEDSWPLN